MSAKALVEALLQPAAYPERPSQVALRQTHISWVFLTDRFVYKVKKPVAFGFLDSTTLAARRFFCHEEVRLNRRLAPQVYLGVVEVKAEDGRIHIGGAGDVVDYAVHMRRLPEERMLPALLAAGRVALGESVSDGRWELVAQQRRAFEPLFETLPSQHLRVDTTPPPEAVAAAVIQQLAQRGEVPWRAGEGADTLSRVAEWRCHAGRGGGTSPGEDDSRCRR